MAFTKEFSAHVTERFRTLSDALGYNYNSEELAAWIRDLLAKKDPNALDMIKDCARDIIRAGGSVNV